MRILLLTLGIILSVTAQAAVGDPIPEKKKISASLSQKEKVLKLVNKQTPSVHLGRHFEEYQYLKNIAEGRSYYYRERYRKKNDRSANYFSNVTSSREEQAFYKPYTPSGHLKMKKFFPRKKKLHYRELFKFGQYKTATD